MWHVYCEVRTKRLDTNQFASKRADIERDIRMLARLTTVVATSSLLV